jgi:hypothetical protein
MVSFGRNHHVGDVIKYSMGMFYLLIAVVRVYVIMLWVACSFLGICYMVGKWYHLKDIMQHVVIVSDYIYEVDVVMSS